MYASIKKSLIVWNSSTNERQKMQHTYIVAVVALIIIAGLVGLVNYQLSQNILTIAFVAAVLWVANLVVWALLQSLVIFPLEKHTNIPEPSRAKKK